MVWTDEMVDELKNLWQKGMTTSEIAKLLGVSKNSVVGKVHRIGLSSRPSPIKTKSDETEEISAPSTKKKCKKTVSPAEVEAPDEKKDDNSDSTVDIKDKHTLSDNCAAKASNSSSSITKLTDLDSHTCRWPIGDPKDENFHFCGNKVKTGQTYCEEHAAIAYVRR